jgi:hypothetical protein
MSENIGDSMPTGDDRIVWMYADGTERRAESGSRYLNNRRASMARLVGVVGVLDDDSALKNWMVDYVDVHLRVGVAREGNVGDAHRWVERLPDRSLAYAGSTIGHLWEAADAFARFGDSRLVDAATTDGLEGATTGDTSGAPPESGFDAKTLRFAAHDLAWYADDTRQRYATDQQSRAGDEDYRLDFRNPRDGSEWKSIRDVHPATVADLHHGDSYLDSHVDGRDLRSDAGSSAWTEYEGTAGTAPGTLFMFDHSLSVT